LLALHWSRIEDVLNQAGDLSGKLIISCSLPMHLPRPLAQRGLRDGLLGGGWGWRLFRATGWGALGLYPEDSRLHQSHGSVWSAPVRLPASGCRVVLNADHTSPMTVEI